MKYYVFSGALQSDYAIAITCIFDNRSDVHSKRSNQKSDVANPDTGERT